MSCVFVFPGSGFLVKMMSFSRILDVILLLDVKVLPA